MWPRRSLLPPQPWALALAATVVGVAASFAGLMFQPRIGIDDANITQVYAKNIAHGLGYVYRAGGERVEGSTSPLWTLINAILFLLPDVLAYGGVYLAAGLSTYFSALAMLRIVDLLAPREARDLSRLVSLVFLCLNVGFFAWSFWSLLDVCLYTAVCSWLIVFCLEILARTPVRAWRVVTLAGAVVLTRPEGVLFAEGVLAVTMLAALLPPREAKGGDLLGLVAAMAFAAVLAVAGAVFRQAYFGYPLPNTYYAKVSSDHVAVLRQGLSYVVLAFLKEGVLPLGFLGLIALALVAWQGAVAGRLDRLKLATTGLAIALGFVAITLVEGGDHFPGQRLLQPLLPLMIGAIGSAGGAILVSRLTPDREAGLKPPAPSYLLPGIAAVVGVTTLTLSAVAYATGPNSIQGEFTVGAQSGQLGETVARLAAKAGPTSLAVIGAGGVALAYSGERYDLEGLNWAAMAHARTRKSGPNGHGSFDTDLFLRTHIDLVPILRQTDRLLTVPAFDNEATKAVVDDPRFQSAYAPVRVRDPGPWPVFLASKAWIARAGAANVEVLDWGRVLVEDSKGVHFAVPAAPAPVAASRPS